MSEKFTEGRRLMSRLEIREKQQDELARLIDYVGGVQSLAAQLDVGYSTVRQWKCRGRISARAAIEVERLSDGKFSKRDLRPDVARWVDEL